MDRSKKNLLFSSYALKRAYWEKIFRSIKRKYAINLENNYKILIAKNKYIQILPLNNNILHGDPNKSKRHVD